MRSVNILLIFAFSLLTQGFAEAGRPRKAAPRTERVARAQWRPIRQVADREVLNNGRSIEAELEPEPEPEMLPLRPMDEGSFSDVEPMMGDISCDAQGCDGECDSMGCSLPGCNACTQQSASWRPCITLCVPQDGWLSFEYLLWYQNGMNLPPLVSRANGTGGFDTIFGGGQELEDSLNGGRIEGGIWLDPNRCWALQGEYFSTESADQGFSLFSNGNPAVGQPFLLPTNTGLVEQQLFIGATGNAGPNGTVSVNLSSQLQGAGLWLRKQLFCSNGCGDTFFPCLPSKFSSRFDALIGYRVLDLDESLITRSDVTTTLSTPVQRFLRSDEFRTRSQFNGLDFGTMYTRTRGCWSLELLTKLAVGNSRQTVRINGTTSIDADVGDATPPVTGLTGGLYALPSNIGVYKRNRFAVVPQLAAELGYQLTPRIKATIGYDFTYWSNVVRPGDQIDRIVDTAQLPDITGVNGAGRNPEFVFEEIDYWVQGISFGAEFQW